MASETTTGLTMVTRAAKTAGILASGETLPADEAQDALAVLNEMISMWATESLTIFYTPRTTYALVANTQVYTIGSGGTFNQQWPELILYAGIIPNGQTFEIPIGVGTVQDWASVTLKTTTSTFPQWLYYDRNYAAGLGSITFWPVPTTACTVALYTPQQLSQFADLTTTYYMPPGYVSALRYGLAELLATTWGLPLDPRIHELAVKTKAAIQRANIPLVTLQVDDALVADSTVWDWRTGQPYTVRGW